MLPGVTPLAPLAAPLGDHHQAVEGLAVGLDQPATVTVETGTPGLWGLVISCSRYLIMR